MPRKYTPIRDLFTPSAGPRDNAWACVRCGWQLVENATRFARHITRCPEATREDRRVALEHLGGLNPEQLQAITFTAELARAFSLGGKAHIRTLFEDTQTTRCAARVAKTTSFSKGVPGPRSSATKGLPRLVVDWQRQSLAGLFRV